MYDARLDMSVNWIIFLNIIQIVMFACMDERWNFLYLVRNYKYGINLIY